MGKNEMIQEFDGCAYIFQMGLVQASNYIDFWLADKPMKGPGGFNLVILFVALKTNGVNFGIDFFSQQMIP